MTKYLYNKSAENNYNSFSYGIENFYNKYSQLLKINQHLFEKT